MHLGSPCLPSIRRLKCIRAYLANLGYQAYVELIALGHVWLTLYFNIGLHPDDFPRHFSWTLVSKLYLAYQAYLGYQAYVGLNALGHVWFT